MVTVNLRRTPAEFWSMTPRETSVLITEWSRMEQIKAEADAERNAYALLSMQNGKVPSWESNQEEKTVVNNDAILGWM